MEKTTTPYWVFAFSPYLFGRNPIPFWPIPYTVLGGSPWWSTQKSKVFKLKEQGLLVERVSSSGRKSKLFRQKDKTLKKEPRRHTTAGFWCKMLKETFYMRFFIVIFLIINYQIKSHCFLKSWFFVSWFPILLTPFCWRKNPITTWYAFDEIP